MEQQVPQSARYTLSTASRATTQARPALLRMKSWPGAETPVSKLRRRGIFHPPPTYDHDTEFDNVEATEKHRDDHHHHHRRCKCSCHYQATSTSRPRPKRTKPLPEGYEYV